MSSNVPIQVFRAEPKVYKKHCLSGGVDIGSQLKLDLDLVGTSQTEGYFIPHICHEPHEHIRVNFLWPV